MGKFYLHVLFIVILILNIDSQFKISASPQLDIPLNHTRGLTSVENQRRIQTNSHTDKELNDSVAKDKEQSNEISIGDTLHYDRDRSQRYGPPYSEENDRRYYYNNENHDENYKSRYLNRNLNGENEGVDDDDDDKYYTQPRSPYYISEKQRNHLGYRDFYSTYNGNYNRYGNNNPYDGNLYDDRNSFNGDRNLYNDDRRTRINNNPRYDNDDDNYSDRNRYSNRDYEQYRLDLERKNRVEDANLRRILADVDKLSSSECFLNVGAQWSFETNVNEATQQESILAQQRYSQFQRELWEKIQTIDKSHIYDDKLYRQVRFMSIIGPNALPPDQFDRYNRIINDMLAIYNKAQICAFDKPFDCGLKLYPDLKEIMARGRDWDELLYVWGEWRRKSGENMKELYEQLVDLTNDAANYNNFSNAAEYWTFPFESYNIRQDMETVWNEVMPLYELIHAYVRRKLREYYGPNRISRNAPLPDHVLGNMYAQTWTNIMDITIPFPGRSFVDVTREMREQGYTPQVMFQIAEEFFLSLNLTALPTDFWLESVLEKPPPDRQLLCQPSAWDFCNRETYRIKMCTNVNHKDLITVHHEMMHVQYFLSYRHQPKVFRDGANSAFHEALGDAISLSVSTPKHLQTLGLIQRPVDDTAHDINFLFSLAMDKVVFLPFALAMDVWRWDVFNKNVVADHYNCHWWLLRERYGGIKPPVLRSEMDFDPGAKFHIPANIPYIRYFIATILQFQIHRAMCKAALQYDPGDEHKPLHKCDIYRQPVAGNILKQIMEKGASQRWQEVLQEAIGEGRLDGTALREYFRPLEEWLRQENLRNNEFVGWNYDGDYCKHSIDTANLQVYGGFYNYATTKQPTKWIILIYAALYLTFNL